MLQLPAPLYSFQECIELLRDCNLDELVALSAHLINEWRNYTIEEQMLLLPTLVKRRKELYHNTDSVILNITSSKFR